MSVLPAALRSTSLNRLLKLAASAGVDSAVRLHINRGDDLNARDGGGLTPLMLAARSNRASTCALLLQEGVDETLVDSCGRDALAIARAANAHLAVAEIDAFIKQRAARSVPSKPQECLGRR